MSAPVLTVDVSEAQPGGVCVLALTGKLDPLAAEEVEAVVKREHAAGHRRFVFDLTKLSYVGSIGLRVFVGLHNTVKHDGDVAACGLAPLVKQVFDLTRVSSVVRVYATRADAIDAVRSR